MFSLRSIVVLARVSRRRASEATVARPLLPLDGRQADTEHIGGTLVAEVVAADGAALVAALLVLVGALPDELGAAAVVGGNAGANGAAEHLRDEKV